MSYIILGFLTGKPKTVLCFYSKTGFWPSTYLDKILHTPIVVWNTLVGRLRPRSAHGAPGQTKMTMFFVILVMSK